MVFDSPLRRDLVGPEPVIKNGRMALNKSPGLGIELNEEAVDRFRTDRWSVFLLHMKYLIHQNPRISSS